VINLSAGDKLVAIAETEHVAIDLQTLERKPLPAVFTRWLEGGGA
jgi:acyl-CoA thioesterase FadM